MAAERTIPKSSQFSRLLLLLLVLTFPAPARAVAPQARQIVVVDSDADPLQLGDRRGCAFVLRYDSTTVRVCSETPGLAHPVAVAEAGEGRLALADAAADPLLTGLDTGALFVVDPRDSLPGLTHESIGSPLLRNPVDVLSEPGGAVLLLDSDADPGRWGGRFGAIFRCLPESHSLSVLAAPAEFREPRSLAWDLDSTLLVLDQTANPLNLGQGVGTIFRVDRVTGATTILVALTSPPFVAPMAVAVLPDGDHAGDLLVADVDADPAGTGNAPGAVFRIPRAGGPPVVFAASSDFSDPSDLIVGTEHDVLVLDRTARPDQLPEGQGAVFRFDRQTGELLQRWTSDLFRNPVGLFQRIGPDIASSQAEWIDATPPALQPADLFTVRAVLRNTGTEDAPLVAAVDSLVDPWSYVIGSDSAGTGALIYDAAAKVLRWSGPLARDQEVGLRFRIHLRDDAPAGRRVRNSFTLTLGSTRKQYVYAGTPTLDFLPGDRVFGDYTVSNGQEQGRIYGVDLARHIPRLLWSGRPLVRPSDLVFLEDGRLAALDRSAGIGDLGAILTVRPSAPAGEQVATLVPLNRADGLVAPSGICLDQDGSLLLIDRDANPLGYPAPDDKCGAIFRLNLASQTWTLKASERVWRQPLDATLDHAGNLLVIDSGAAAQDSAVIWEFQPGASSSLRHDLPGRLFGAPTGLCTDANDDIYVADPASPAGTRPGTGAVLKVSRRPSWSFSVASADTVFRAPSDCAVEPNGGVLISDLDANPIGYILGDRGAVFRLYPLSNVITIASGSEDLRRPDGVTVRGQADLFRSSLGLRAGVVGTPGAGDTLHCSIVLTNLGTAGAPQATAQISFSPTVILERGSASEGDLQLDPPGVAGWSGRLGVADSVRLEFRVRVAPDVVFGAAAGVSALIDGGARPFTLARSLAVRGIFPPNDLLVADENANPNHRNPAPGAIFRLPGKGEPVDLVLSQSGLLHPTCLEWDKDGYLIIGATQGTQSGAIYRFDPTQGLVQLGNINPSMRTPVDLLYNSQRDLIIVDRDTPGTTTAARGAIFKLPHNAFLPASFSQDTLYRAPVQITFGPGGALYLVDSQANPSYAIGRHGAIFTIDPNTGRVLDSYQSPLFSRPTGIISWDDSTLIITDQTAAGADSASHGALFSYRPARRQLRTFLASTQFRAPKRSLRATSGELLILDTQAGRVGAASGPGATFSYDPQTQVLSRFALCDSFVTLSDIVQKPGPTLQLAEYGIEDLSGPPLHSADQIRVRALLRSVGLAAVVGGVWNDTLPSEVSLIPSTAQASSGLLESGGRILRWTGNLSSPDSVSITFDVQLNPAMSEGKLLTFRSTCEGPGLPTTRSTSIFTYAPLQPGFLYLLDAAARPFGDGQKGCIFKVNLSTGSTVPMFASPLFRKPRSLALIGSTHPRFLVLDDSAAVPQGKGGLFFFDPVSQEVTLAAWHATWKNPVKVVPVGENEAWVLDAAANPFNLRVSTPNGPGALYRVILSNGQVLPLFSDSTWGTPASMARLPDGRALICSQGADPGGYGLRGGALFTLSPDSLILRPFAWSPFWRQPVAVAVRGDSSVVMLDAKAPAGVPLNLAHGAMYNIGPHGGMVDTPLLSTLFSNLVDVAISASGHPVLCDSKADPFNFGSPVGAVLQWDSQLRSRFYPLASNRAFVSPVGMVVYRDLTPVEATEATVTAADDGVLLRWRQPFGDNGQRSLIYRRTATGPEDPGDAAPVDYALVAADEDFLGAGPHEYLDREVTPGGWYVYLIARIAPSGAVTYSSPLLIQAPAQLLRLDLAAAGANPFRDSARLRLTIPRPGGRTVLAVYDVAGRQVRSLVRGDLEPGIRTLSWDGRDDRGHPLGSGLYFARVRHAGKVRTLRLVRLR